MGHPNIVDAYDLGKFEDAFIVTEYIHGVSGAQLLTKSYVRMDTCRTDPR